MGNTERPGLAAPVLVFGAARISTVDLRIDLDAAAAEMSARLRERSDLDIGPLTWKDMNAPYDAPFPTDRAEVEIPYSVGVHVLRGNEEGLLVLYAGGWADLEYWTGSAADDPILRVPGYDDWLDVPRFAAVVDEFLGFFQRYG